MKIAMIGSGYVGLVSGACFADFGHDVVCIDKDASKIDRLRQGVMPIYEPGLDALVETNVKAARLSFTTDLAEGIRDAQAIFIAVGTPSRRGGRACRPVVRPRRRTRSRGSAGARGRGGHKVDRSGRHR